VARHRTHVSVAAEYGGGGIARDFPRNVPGAVAPCVWENPGSSDLQLLAC